MSSIKISHLPEKRFAWLLLLLSASALLAYALYSQHMNKLNPCIMCIYQRTAVIGILLSALWGLLFCHNRLGRMFGYAGWLTSSIWGALIAWEHIDLQQAANPFFVSCEIVPNFPSWLPLHEWFPAVFAATGDCGDINWQFTGLSMPQWMLIILTVYSVVGIVVLMGRWLRLRRF